MLGITVSKRLRKLSLLSDYVNFMGRVHIKDLSSFSLHLRSYRVELFPLISSCNKYASHNIKYQNSKASSLSIASQMKRKRRQRRLEGQAMKDEQDFL